MKKIKLGDILEIQPKSKVKAGEGITNGKYPFYTCSNELTKSVNTADYEGDALIMGTGGMASIHYEKGKFSTSTDCLVYKSNKNVNLSLINKYLRTNIYLLENGFKGAGLRHISRDYISNITIPLPERNLQDKIVKELDLIEKTITNHNDVLKKYDTLIKSRFIEMFGDPKINSSNLPTKKFIEVVKLQRGFDLPVQERNQDGLFNVYGSNGPLDKHDSFKVKAPGIVTGRSGTLGNVYYVLEDYWPLNTTLFSVDIHNNNVVYLKYLLELYDLSRFSEGAGVPTLNRNIVHDKDIIDVPLSLQNDFAAFVQQIDKSKFEMEKIVKLCYTTLM